MAKVFIEPRVLQGGEYFTESVWDLDLKFNLNNMIVPPLYHTGISPSGGGPSPFLADPSGNNLGVIGRVPSSAGGSTAPEIYFVGWASSPAYIYNTDGMAPIIAHGEFPVPQIRTPGVYLNTFQCDPETGAPVVYGSQSQVYMGIGDFAVADAVVGYGVTGGLGVLYEQTVQCQALMDMSVGDDVRPKVTVECNSAISGGDIFLYDKVGLWGIRVGAI